MIQFFDGRDRRPVNLTAIDTLEGTLVGAPGETVEMTVRIVGPAGTRFRFAELGLTLATEREAWLQGEIERLTATLDEAAYMAGGV